MCDCTRAEERTLDRRTLLRGAAGTLAAAGMTTTLAWPEAASAHPARPRTRPAPKPIPGGLPTPAGPIHIFLPGPESVTLPFTGSTLQGLDVEPSTITDFRGKTVLAYLMGTATGSDGTEYNLEADIRAFEGTYVPEDGSSRTGTFALI